MQVVIYFFFFSFKIIDFEANTYFNLLYSIPQIFKMMYVWRYIYRIHIPVFLFLKERQMFGKAYFAESGCDGRRNIILRQRSSVAEGGMHMIISFVYHYIAEK